MKQYTDLLKELLRDGERRDQSRGMPSFSLFGRHLSFDLRDGFPMVTVKHVPFKSVIAELVGFTLGVRDAQGFNDLGTKIWDANATADYWANNPNRQYEGDLGRIYGVQWVSWRSPVVQPSPLLRKGIPASYLGVANGAGKEHHPLRKVWEGMIARCYDTASVSYSLYGGIGVSVCNSWLEFKAFAADAILLPGASNRFEAEGGFEYQLDKDTIGDGYLYSPETCAWVSAKENSDAKRRKTYVVQRDGVEYAFTNVTEFCTAHGVEPKNFSDLWTGNKNAKKRGGFTLVRVDEAPGAPRGVRETDQLAQLVEELKSNPQSRRHLVTAWNPGELDQMALPPCHVMFQCYVSSDGYLDLQMYQRSCDAFLGLPFNIASYAALLTYLAAVCGYKPRHLKITLGDVHLYENQIEGAALAVSREPLPLPQLKIRTESPDLAAISTDLFILEGYLSHPSIPVEMVV